MGLLDVPNSVTPEEYERLRRRESWPPPTYLRVFCGGTIEGHRVRFVVECEEDFEARAVRWLERQRRVNHLDGDIDREVVVNIDGRRGGNAE